METKHTPGPWRMMRCGTANDENALCIRADGGVWIANVLRQGTESDRSANAALIAAAPTLLAAAEGMVAAHAWTDTVGIGSPGSDMRAAQDERRAALAALRSAIAAAKGA